MEQTDGRAERVIRTSRALGEDVRVLKDELGAAAQELREKMDFSETVQAHPFRAVLIAAGVGYVLGGGLFSPLTGRLVAVGARAVLLPMLAKQLEGMATGAGE
jgi:hypothetical protein